MLTGILRQNHIEPAANWRGWAIARKRHGMARAAGAVGVWCVRRGTTRRRPGIPAVPVSLFLVTQLGEMLWCEESG
jgi:hypothetical protein